MKHKTILSLLVLTLLAGQSQAQIQGQLGMLSAETLAGNNPATGNPWAIGDTYHLTYITTSTTEATSTDIADYNAFVRADADSGGMGAANWFVMGSTAATDARDNAVISGPVINISDQGLVAVDATDLWDLNFSVSANPTTLAGGAKNVHSGTVGGGTAHGSNELGASNGTVRIAWSAWTRWDLAWRAESTSDLKPLVAISEELTIVGPESQIQLTIANDGADLDFEWDSQPGMVYLLWSHTDITADLAAWESVNLPGSVENNGVFEISTNPPRNMHTIPRPADPTRFYRVQEIPLPPVTVFEENFDGAAGPGLPTDWTSGTNPADNSSLTSWEVGTPANVGPIPPGVPLPSGANCVATNISGNYDDPLSDLGIAHTDIWLRTPAIDVGAATAGMLAFQHWTQIEDVPGDLDYGSIRILDANDDSELAVMEPQSIDGNTTGWEEYSMALPAEAFTATAGTIKVEFRFEADDIDSFAGWYIDDVTVTTPAP